MNYRPTLTALIVGSVLLMASCQEESPLPTITESSSDSDGVETESASESDSVEDDSAQIDPVEVDLVALGLAAWKQGSCSTCHSADGTGNQFGPDLTDDTWVNSDGSHEGIRAVLLAGVPKDQMKSGPWRLAMPPATALITDQESIDALAAHVRRLSQSHQPEDE